MDPQYLTAGEMNKFVVRELIDGALLPLTALIDRLPLIKASSWAFKHTKFHYGSPFGLTIPEFERITWENEQGFVVADADFRLFLRTDFQLIDGEVEALDAGGILLTIDCLDASQWEISVQSAQLAAELENRGFKRVGTERGSP